MKCRRWFALMILVALVGCRSTDKTPEAKPPARAPELEMRAQEPAAPSPEPAAPQQTATPEKTPDAPPEAAPTETSSAPRPPKMTDEDLACEQDRDCVLANVWEWVERTGGYCNTCDSIAMNRSAAAKFEKWYYAHHGKNCAKLNCAPRGLLGSQCVKSLCVRAEEDDTPTDANGFFKPVDRTKPGPRKTTRPDGL